MLILGGLMPWITPDEWATLLALTVSSLFLFIYFPLVNPWSKCCPLFFLVSIFGHQKQGGCMSKSLASTTTYCVITDPYGWVWGAKTHRYMCIPADTHAQSHKETYTHTHTHTVGYLMSPLFEAKFLLSLQYTVPCSISKVFERSPRLSSESHGLHESQQSYKQWHCDWCLTFQNPSVMFSHDR